MVEIMFLVWTFPLLELSGPPAQRCLFGQASCEWLEVAPSSSQRGHVIAARVIITELGWWSNAGFFEGEKPGLNLIQVFLV